MGHVMRIDVVSVRRLITAAVISVLILIVAIIIGATGPTKYILLTYSMINCPDGSRIWHEGCLGPNISINGTKWEVETPSFNLLNNFWVLEMVAFTKPGDGQEYNLRTSVDIYAKEDPNDSKWIALRVADIHQETIVCFSGDAVCTGFLLIYEEFIDYKVYLVDITFPDQHNWLTDMDVQIIYVNPEFSKFAMSIRLVYSFINVIALAIFVWAMKGIPFSEWEWEQRGILVMHLVLICFNNPLYPFEFVAHGWFFRFVSALFADIFNCIILLFWLFTIDKIRRDEIRLELTCTHVPKIVIVAIYGILSLVLFAWVSIRDQQDPVYGTNILGVQILYYIVIMLWTGIVVWVGILSGLTTTIVIQKKYMLPRFLFFVIPTGICILSILAGIFAGTFGIFGETGITFLYYLTLYNVWVYFLTWGYARVQEGFSSKRIMNEASPLTATQRAQEPEEFE